MLGGSAVKHDVDCHLPEKGALFLIHVVVNRGDPLSLLLVTSSLKD